jgi:hypothetical protein
MPQHKQGAEPDAGQLSKILRASGISLSPAQTGQGSYGNITSC